MAASEYGLSIVLDFQDRASSGIQKTLGLFQNLSGSVNNLTKDFGDTGDTLWGLNSSIVGMSVMGNQFEDMGKGMYSTLGKVANSVMETGSSFESFRITMGALHGSTEAADEEIEKLFNYATKSPYMVKDLQDVMVTFRSLGLDAFGDVTNASTGFSESLMSWMGDLQSFRPGEAMSRWKRGLQNFLSGSNTQSATVLRNILDVGDIATFVGHDLGKTVEERVQTLTDIVTKLNLQGVQDNLSATWGITISNMQDVWDKFTYDIGFGRKKSNMYTLAVNAAKNLLQIEQDLLGNKGVIEAVSKSFENLIKPLERATYIMTLFSPAISEWLGRHPELFTFAEGLTAISGAGLITTGILLKLSGSVLNWMNNVQRLGGLEAILRTISSASKLAFLNVLKFSSLPILGALAYNGNWFGLKDFLSDAGGQISSLFEEINVSMKDPEKPLTFFQALEKNGLSPFVKGLNSASAASKELSFHMYEGFRGFFEFFGVNMPIYEKETFNLKKSLNDFGKSLTEKFGGDKLKELSDNYGGLIKTLGTLGAAFLTAFAASSVLKLGMALIKFSVVDLIGNLQLLFSTLASPAGLLGIGLGVLVAGYKYNFGGLHDSLAKPVSDLQNARKLLIEMKTGYGGNAHKMAEEFGLLEFAEGLSTINFTWGYFKQNFLQGFGEAGGSFAGLFGSIIKIFTGSNSVTDILNGFGGVLWSIAESPALPHIAQFLGTVAAAATTAGGKLIILGGIFSGVIAPLISSIGTMGTLIFGAFTNPFILATAALTAYATNFGGVKDKVDAFIGKLSGIKRAYTTLKSNFKEFRENGTINGGKDEISEAEFFNRKLYLHKVGLSDNKNDKIYVKDVNNIFDLLDNKTKIFSSFISGLKDGVKQTLSTVLDLVSAFFKLPDKLSILDGIKKLNKYLGDIGLEGILKNSNDLGKSVGEIVTKIGLLLPMIGTVSKLGGVMEKTFGVKVSPLTAGLKLVNDGFKMITSGASEMKNAVVGALRAVSSTAKGLGRDIYSSIKDVFKFRSLLSALGGGASGGILGSGVSNYGVPQRGLFSYFTPSIAQLRGLGKSMHHVNPNIFGSDMGRYIKVGGYGLGSFLTSNMKGVARDNFGNIIGYTNSGNTLSAQMGSWWRNQVIGRFKGDYKGAFRRSIQDGNSFLGRYTARDLQQSKNLTNFFKQFSSKDMKAIKDFEQYLPRFKTQGIFNQYLGWANNSANPGAATTSFKNLLAAAPNVRNVKDLNRLYSYYNAYNHGGLNAWRAYNRLDPLAQGMVKGKMALGFVADPSKQGFSSSVWGKNAFSPKALFNNLKSNWTDPLKRAKNLQTLGSNFMTGLESFGLRVAQVAPQLVANFAKITFGIQMLKITAGVQVFGKLVASLGQLAMGAAKVALGFTKMSVGLSLISLGVMTFGTMATSEWKGLTDAIKEQETPLGKIKAAYEWFTGHLSSNVSKLTEKMANFDVSGFVQKIMGVAGNLGDTLLALVGGSNGNNGMAEILASTFDNLLSGINEGSKYSGKLFNVLSGIFNSSMQSLRTHIPSIGASIRGILFNALNFAAANIDSLVATTGELLVSLFDVKDPKKTADLGIKIINSILDGIIKYAPQIIDGADEVVSTFLKRLNNPTTKEKFVLAARTLIFHLGNSIKENGKLLWDLAVPVFKALWTDIVATFSDGIADCMFKVAGFSTGLGILLTAIGGVTGNPIVLTTGIGLLGTGVGAGALGGFVKGYGETAKLEVQKGLTFDSMLSDFTPKESTFYGNYPSHIEGMDDKVYTTPEEPKDTNTKVKDIFDGQGVAFIDPNNSIWNNGSNVFTTADKERFNDFLEVASTGLSSLPNARIDKYVKEKDGTIKKQAGHIVSIKGDREFTGVDETGKFNTYAQPVTYYWVPGYNEKHKASAEEAMKKGQLVGADTYNIQLEISEAEKEKFQEEVSNLNPQTDVQLNMPEADPINIETNVVEGEQTVEEAVNGITENAQPEVQVPMHLIPPTTEEVNELISINTENLKLGMPNAPTTLTDLRTGGQELKMPIEVIPDFSISKKKGESNEEWANRILREANIVDEHYNMNLHTIKAEAAIELQYNQDKFKETCQTFFNSVKTAFNGFNQWLTERHDKKQSDMFAHFGVEVTIDKPEIEESKEDVKDLKNELDQLPDTPTVTEVTDNGTAKITTGNIVEVANALSNLRSNNKATVEITADTSSLKAAEEAIDKFYNKYGFAKPGFNISNKSASSSEVKDGNAKGTNNWKGGLTWVHETGAEIIDLPSGTRIVPRARSLVEMYNRGLEDGFITTPTNDLDGVLFAPEPSAAQIIQSVTNVTTSPTQVIASKGGGTSQDSYDYSVHFESGSVVIHIDNPQSDLDYKKAAEKIMYYAAEKQRRMAMARR